MLQPTPDLDRPAQILAAAERCFARSGFHRATMQDVAREAGMSPGNLYRYFPSKAALIDAVAGQWLRSLEAVIADIADAPDPADDKLERLLQAWARTHRDLLMQDRHLFDVYSSATETSRALIRKHRARMRLLIERVLDEGIATGKFEPRERAALVIEIWAEASRNPDIAEITTGFERGLKAGLTAVIEAGKARGEVEPDLDTSFTVRMMAMLADGLFKRRVLGTDFDPDREIDDTLSVFRALLRGAVRPNEAFSS